MTDPHIIIDGGEVCHLATAESLCLLYEWTEGKKEESEIPCYQDVFSLSFDSSSVQGKEKGGFLIRICVY